MKYHYNSQCMHELESYQRCLLKVMLQSGKYELVHEFFRKMKRSGEAPRATTYKGDSSLIDVTFTMHLVITTLSDTVTCSSVLVTSLWREGKAGEAVEAVRDMERRGVVGTASVYYELACCLCNNGRWQEAMLEVMGFPSTVFCCILLDAIMYDLVM